MQDPSVEISCLSFYTDIPQMQCIRAFVAQQPDELSLEKADVLLVHEENTDGEYLCVCLLTHAIITIQYHHIQFIHQVHYAIMTISIMTLSVLVPNMLQRIYHYQTLQKHFIFRNCPSNAI